MTASLRQRLQTLVETLPEASLLQAESLLVQLNPSIAMTVGEAAGNGRQSSEEAPLLAIIERRLPIQAQTRLNFLRQRLADETITEAEHQELLTFIEPIEQMDAARVEAMIQLAQLRKVDLNTIIQEFLPHPQPSDVV
jgi:hypothetical protein